MCVSTTISITKAKNNRKFISGHIRVTSRNNRNYPFKVSEMIDTLFGKEDNTIEVNEMS